jgi:predicted transcriptional regulator
MDTQDSRVAAQPRLVRSSVLLREDTDEALRKLAAQGKRPLSWEIRLALEDHVSANAHQLKEAA